MTQQGNTKNTYPAAQAMFGDEIACVGEFNSLAPIAKQEVDAALAFVASSTDRQQVLVVLEDLREALSGRYGAMTARLAQALEPMRAAALPKPMAQLPAPTPAPSPIAVSTMPVAAAAPIASATAPAKAGGASPFALLPADVRAVVETAIQNCQDAPTQADAVAYLRETAREQRAACPDGAGCLEMIAATMEQAISSETERLFAALDAESRALVEAAIEQCTDAPGPAAIVAYLAEIAAECESKSAGAARCLRSYATTIQAAASAAPALAAA